MYKYWINRKELWFNHMVCVVSSVYYWCSHEWFLSGYAFSLYMLCMWFHVSKQKSKGEEEWMSFNCFSKWTRGFLQGVQLNLFARSAWLQSLLRDSFCSHFLEECRFGTRAVQGVRRLDEVSDLRFWAKCWKTTVAGVCRVERIQHLDVVEDLPQGVCARSPQGDVRSW